MLHSHSLVQIIISNVISRSLCSIRASGLYTANMTCWYCATLILFCCEIKGIAHLCAAWITLNVPATWFQQCGYSQLELKCQFGEKKSNFESSPIWFWSKKATSYVPIGIIPILLHSTFLSTLMLDLVQTRKLTLTCNWWRIFMPVNVLFVLNQGPFSGKKWFPYSVNLSCVFRCGFQMMLVLV